jgi:hypothetical protein
MAVMVVHVPRRDMLLKRSEEMRRWLREQGLVEVLVVREPFDSDALLVSGTANPCFNEDETWP